jgi:hypothetical protein
MMTEVKPRKKMMVKLNQLFEVSYGNKFDLNKMTLMPREEGGVSFVGRSGKNNGIGASVARLMHTSPYEAGLITVALGGAILSSFVQEHSFYTAQNVAVLRPRFDMTFSQKVYVCLCIRANLFRYGAFGREANRTLRVLEIPNISEFPQWLDEVDEASVIGTGPAREHSTPMIQLDQWKPFVMGDLFTIKKGSRITKQDQRPGKLPFIGAIDSNNGLSAYIDAKPLHHAGTITVNYNGNGVAEAYYQPRDYWCSDDVNVLYPRSGERFDPAIALFLAAVIRREKYRFSYGRKWSLERMNVSTLYLPACRSDKEKTIFVPDWAFMKSYIETLPLSSQLE